MSLGEALLEGSEDRQEPGKGSALEVSPVKGAGLCIGHQVAARALAFFPHEPLFWGLQTRWLAFPGERGWMKDS